MEPFDIEKIGPGAWYIIHLMGAKSKTKEEIKSFHILIKMISQSFFCDRCRKHFNKNLGENPPPLTNNVNELFAWTVEMHNRVNEVKGEEIIEHMDALDYYIGYNSRCLGDCGSKKSYNLKIDEMLLRVLTSGDRTKFISEDRSGL